MTDRRTWIRRGLYTCLGLVGAHQLWRHGNDYVFLREFVVVEPGKIYRGAWQKSWPMHRIVNDYKVKTVLALAHPDDHPLSVSEKALSEELGFKWIHIPIVDNRNLTNQKSVSDLLDESAAILADPKNYPIYFHCHHGLNRASMAQIAYRTKYCGWTLDQATDEISKTVGLVKVTHGPDYRHMVNYYNTRVLPFRKTQEEEATASTATTNTPAPAASAVEVAAKPSAASNSARQ